MKNKKIYSYFFFVATPLAILLLNIHTFHYASKLVEAIQHANARSEAIEISLRIQNQLAERTSDLKILSEVWENHKKDHKYEHFKKIAEGFTSGNYTYHAINYVDADSIIRATVPKKNEATLLGRNLKELPGRVEMHASARSSGQALASPSMMLVGKYPGFIIWQPLGKDDQDKFHGFVAAAIKIDDLVKTVLHKLPNNSFKHIIRLDSHIIFSDINIENNSKKNMTVEESFQTLGRTWIVSVWPRSGTPLSRLRKPITWNLFIGISIALLTGLLLFLAAYLNRKLFNAKAASNASEEDLRITLSSIGDAVIATNIDGNIRSMNPVAEKLTGWSSREALGLPLCEIFKIIHAYTRQPAIDPVKLVLESGEIVGLDNHTLLISRNGEEYQIADSGAPIRDDHGTIRGVVLVFRDVTEEYALQEQLRQSQKLQAIGQLAGGVAHDFNNILAGIMGSAELLQKMMPENPLYGKYISMILKSSERAAELTGKLLTFARKRITNSDTFDVHHVITDALDLLKSTSDPRIQFNLSLNAKPSYVDGDLPQLQNALLNIALNAVQAMPDGGLLDISSSIVMIDIHYCQSSQFDIDPGTYVNIELRDTGRGIDPKSIDMIFDPFFTTKIDGSGTGLGLPAVYGTVLAHKGAITVYSEPGTGTSFHILLPLSDKETEDIPVMDNPLIKGSGRILLIDDEEAIRITGGAILENLGYDVTLGTNGQHGLEIFKSGPDDFDLVILDMIMPVMNGRDCFFAMQNIRKGVRVILSSGFTREDELQTMMEQGLKGFIRKPFRAAELSALVHEILNPIT